MSLKIGSNAPEIKLLDQNGKTQKLSSFRGQPVLVYFYPKDDTPGCTKEACTIRDDFDNFDKLQLKVLGISADSVAKHKKFAEKYKLPFTLLADTEKKTVEDYGVWAEKKFMGRRYMGILRNSFLINHEGKIIKIYENVKPAVHALEVIKDLKELG